MKLTAVEKRKAKRLKHWLVAHGNCVVMLGDFKPGSANHAVVEQRAQEDLEPTDEGRHEAAPGRGVRAGRTGASLADGEPMSKHIKDRVAEKLVEGKGVAEAAEELGVHRNSVSYHKKALTSIDSDSVQEYRASQLIELSELKAQLVSPNIPPVKKVELALAIIDREIDLLGTKAPTKSIQARIDADVDPEQLIGYRRFVHETRGLDQDAIESVYQFARQLSRPDVVEHAPPQESELWEEGS